jgi:hypothetical protein
MIGTMSDPGRAVSGPSIAARSLFHLTHPARGARSVRFSGAVSLARTTRVTAAALLPQRMRHATLVDRFVSSIAVARPRATLVAVLLALATARLRGRAIALAKLVERALSLQRQGSNSHPEV